MAATPLFLPNLALVFLVAVGVAHVITDDSIDANVREDSSHKDVCEAGMFDESQFRGSYLHNEVYGSGYGRSVEQEEQVFNRQKAHQYLQPIPVRFMQEEKSSEWNNVLRKTKSPKVTQIRNNGQPDSPDFFPNNETDYFPSPGQEQTRNSNNSGDPRMVLSPCGEYMLYDGEMVQITAEPYRLPHYEDYRCYWSFFTINPQMKLFLECTEFNLKSCQVEQEQEYCWSRNNMKVVQFANNYAEVGMTSYNETKKPTKVESEGLLDVILRAQATYTNPRILCTVRAETVLNTTEAKPSRNCTENCGTGQTPVQIVSGQEADLGEWPWTGVVVTKDFGNVCNLMCDVTVVHNLWVLTSAVCIIRAKNAIFQPYVVLGATDFSNMDDIRYRYPIDLDRSVIHPAYHIAPLTFDIGLIRLDKVAIFSDRVQPACLPQVGTNYELQDAVMAGWGFSEEGVTSPVKKVVSLQVWNWMECRSHYAEFISLSMMCASVVGEAPCYENTGNGLMWQGGEGQWTVVGVASWNTGCAKPKQRTVYTEVSKAVSWIQRTIDCENTELNTPTYVPLPAPICGVANTDTRIWGGEEAQINEFPWQVGLALKWKTKPFCGGAIISRLHILTIASCISYFPERLHVLVDVLVGFHTVNDTTATPEAARYTIHENYMYIYIHEGYNRYYSINDIAIITLADPIVFKSSNLVAPICLPQGSNNTYVGSSATVTGWGSNQDGEYPNELHKVTVDIISNQECSTLYDYEIRSTEVCAHVKEGGKDSCRGDGGSPLVVEEEGVWQAVGLVVWGIGCGEAEHPGVHTRLSEYTDWIYDRTYGTNLHYN